MQRDVGIRVGAAAAVPALLLGLALTGNVAPPQPLAVLGAFHQPRPVPAPAAVAARWQALVGTWLADNSRYRSDAEQIDAYGIEWAWGLNRKTLTGRLYGLRAGKDIGTFWEFREFWHPGERTVMALQFGSDGTYGAGPHRVAADGSSEMLQTFFDPGQREVRRVGHRARLEGDVHTTVSYDVDDREVWKERRTYTWRRQVSRDR